MRVLAGKVLIETVCESDRQAAEAIAREMGIVPHWHAKIVERKARRARVKKEKPIIGHILNLSGRAYECGAAA
jgi:hypothetical protein